MTSLLTRAVPGGGPGGRVASDWTQLGRSGIDVAGAVPAAQAVSQRPVVRSLAAEVLTPAQGSAAGLSGIVLRLARQDGVSAAAPVAVSVPDRLLDGLYGADYASRVRWVQLPSADASAAGQARQVASTRSNGATVLTPEVGSDAVLLAAVGAPGGAAGSFSATSLKPSSSWQVSAQTGAFAWSYPMRTPPAAAGPAPGIGLAYNSQNVDGETGSTNNQPDEIGDGWSLTGLGFIERGYVPCAQDDGPTGRVTSKYDECWSSDNATLLMGGHSGRLIKVNATTWRLQNDDGTRIEHLTGNGCGNATYDNDCWRVTTLDGTQYWFGRNELPGWASGKATTNSAWTVPVFGNDPGEPGYNGDGTHAGTFATEVKTQAWRWNLDYVVDPNDNSEAYYYKTESNDYRENGTTVVSYVRGGYLDHIDYGMRAGTEYATNAASDKVVFGQDAYGRCNDFSARSTNCTKEYPTEAKPTKPADYPDTPWDQYCSAAPCTNLVAPSFWSAQMLSTISTQYWNATSSAYQTVDTWTLGHSFPANGEGTLKNAPAEWLTQIVHTAGSFSLTTSFAGLPMPNRVDDDMGFAQLWKYRIISITNDTGAVTTIGYSAPACQSASDPIACGTNLRAAIHANPQTNQRLVYPQFWTPPQSTTGTPQQDIFNKYVVTEVDDDPHTGGAIDDRQTTQYVYTGSPAWRFDTSAAGSDESRTWSDYAGYDAVEIRVGDPNRPSGQQTTDYTYFQGLDGDPDGPPTSPTSATRNVTVSASNGSTVSDSPWFAGQVREVVSRVGANGGAGASSTPALSDTINTPWASAAKATWTYSYDTTDPNNSVRYRGTLSATAYLVGTAKSDMTSPLSAGGNRSVITTYQYDDAYGLTTQVQTVASDLGSTCTTTSYAQNTANGLYLIDYPKEVTKVGAGCGASIDYSQVPATDTRMSYDGSAWGVAPTRGNVTETDSVKDFTGASAATAEWITAGKSTYDALGRPLAVTDAMGQVTKTVYTPTDTSTKTGPLVKTVATNPSPFNWATTTVDDPRWGVPTAITDQNNHVTAASYDALGRLTGVWLPDRPQSTHASSPTTGYAYTVSRTAASAVATTTLNPNGTSVTSYVLYDGLGRTRQTQAPAETRNTSDGSHTTAGTVVTDTGYDAAGRVDLTNGAYYTPSVSPSAVLFAPSTTLPGQVANSFDGAGRSTAAIQYIDGTESWRTTTAYQGADRVDITPPAGGTASTTYVNSAGATSKLVQYLSGSQSGTSEPTTYTYDAFGHLTGTTNAAGESWTWRYDALGREIGASDPDAGPSSTVYNNDGTVASTTTANGTLKYAYDHIGRKTTETDGSGNVLASWDYDPTYGATQVKGQLAAAHRYVTSGPTAIQGTYTNAVTGYDADDRPTGSSITVPSAVATQFGLPTAGASYATAMSYDADGSVATAKDLTAAAGLPAETLTYRYTNLGDLYVLGSNKTGLLGDVSYTHTNELAQLDLTNGVTEVDRTFAYQDGSNRLTNSSTITSAATGFHAADDAYTYSDAGDTTSDTQSADGIATDTQCFTYDALRNLADAWTPSSGDCASAPSSAALGGPSPYWTSYQVDAATGNRTRTIEHAVTAIGSDTKDVYRYPSSTTQFKNGNGGGNALASVDHATAAAGTDPVTGAWTPSGAVDQFTYNADGGTKSLPGQTLTYDAEGRLSATTVTSGANAGTTQNSVYDADGHLLLQTDAVSGTMLDLGDTVLHVNADGGRTGTRTYTALGTPIAERTSDVSGTNTVDWLCPAPNGTSNLELNASTLAATRRYSDPFGNPRAGSPTNWSSANGFLNKPVDQLTRTTQLGARVYDAAIGRFLTVDPVVDTASPQQVNGYSYANNSPVTLSDPAGTDPPPPPGCNAACRNCLYANQDCGQSNLNQLGCGSAASCDHDSGADSYTPPAGNATASAPQGQRARDAVRKVLVPLIQCTYMDSCTAAQQNQYDEIVAALPQEAPKKYECKGTFGFLCELSGYGDLQNCMGGTGSCGSLILDGISYVPGLEEVKGAELAGKAVVDAKDAMKAVREAGKVGEARAGIVKNTRRIESMTGKAAYRIPDELSDVVVGEVKNVKYQGYTSQIQDDVAFALTTNRQFNLYVRQSTKFGPMLQTLIDMGVVTRVPTLGP